MGDHDHCRALFAIEGEDEVEDGAAGGAIEIAGGFVGEEDGRAEGKGAGEGDALLFAAGELDGVVIEAAGEADAVEEFAGAGAAAGIAAGEFHGEEHVFFGGEGGEEMVGLEDEADFAAAELGHGVFAEVRDVFAIEDDLTGGGRVESGEEAEEGAFAAAGGAHDGGKLAAGNFEVDAFEDFDAVGSGVDGLGESADLDQTSIMALR